MELETIIQPVLSCVILLPQIKRKDEALSKVQACPSTYHRGNRNGSRSWVLARWSSIGNFEKSHGDAALPGRPAQQTAAEGEHPCPLARTFIIIRSFILFHAGLMVGSNPTADYYTSQKWHIQSTCPSPSRAWSSFVKSFHSVLLFLPSLSSVCLSFLQNGKLLTVLLFSDDDATMSMRKAPAAPGAPNVMV